jgi:hypothetical protein
MQECCFSKIFIKPRSFQILQVVSFPSIKMALYSLLIGLIGILCAGFLTAFLTKKSTDIFYILVFALAIRILSVLIHTYFYALPIGVHDAVRFELSAWYLTELVDGSVVGFIELYTDIINQEAPEAYEILRDLSWTYVPLFSFFYIVLDRSPLLLNSFSISIGMLTVYFAWLITLKVWESRVAAKKSAFIMAFFPPLIMYSSVTLREIFVILFLQLFVLYFITWRNEGKKSGIFYSFFSAIPHLILHHPMFLVLMLSYLAPALSFIKKQLKNLLLGNFKSLFIKVCFLVFVLIFSTEYIKSAIDFFITLPIPYLGELQYFGLSNIVAYTQHTNYGNASYPSFVVLRTTSELITLLPLRVLYFMYSPFIWDVKSIAHLVGVFDSLLYFYLTFLFFSNYKYIKKNKKLQVIILIFIVGVIVYSFGVGNFANAMRHRIKLLTLLVIIVAPFLFAKKIKSNK